jgi:hypothetical protein
MKSDIRTETHKPSITETVWIDPFVVQYQLDELLPCVVAIDHADRDSRWFDSKILDDSVDCAARDSHQLNFAAWAPPLEHGPLLRFAGDCLAHYLKALPQADKFPSFTIQEAYNILKYEPGQAYHHTHTDYSPNGGVSGTRHLSFVLFLNTVTDGGELEFVQQSLRVQPVEDRYVFQLWWSFND